MRRNIEIPGVSGTVRCGRRLRARAAMLGAVAVLAACVGDMVNPRVPPAGGSEDFNSAYIQGCDSGFHDAGWDGWEALYYKDAAAYSGRPDYQKGWELGHRGCYEYGMARPRPESDHGGGGHGM